MPFAFKLACRLARLKHRTLAGAAAAVAAAVVLSCELPVQVATPNAPVSQLIIIPHTVTLQLNQDQDFVAVGLSAAGDTTPSTVSWDVTGGTITDMGASGGRHYGQYHGGTCGSFKVAATSHPDRTTDTATVTVAGCVAPVASVTVTPASASVPQGATVQLTATPRDANGTALTGRVVTWGSNNTAVATVSGSGLVSGAGAGSATITATSEGQSGTAAITVTAPTGQLAIGDSVQATTSTWVRNIAQPPADPATGTPPSVIGTQPAGARGVVDSGPVLNTTPGGDGAIRYHVLFAAAPSGWVVQDYLAKIVPTVPVAAVTVSPASVSVLQGQTVQLTATPRDASGNPLTGRVITWQSSNSAIASVNGSGLVSGVAAGGPVTMTATSEGQSGTASITVSGVPVASVTVSPASASVPVGQTQQLTATLRDANGTILTGRSVTWASNNTPVATVTGTGLVTAKVAGSATITATSEGQSGTASITVTPVPVASVTVTPASGSVAVGSTLQLTATPRDANGNPLTGRVITWQASNNAIASVNGSGLVSGVAAGGPVTITATSEGQSGTSAITVTPPGTSVVLVGAGDIADCNAEPTAALLDNIAGTVFTAGDNAYPNGTASDYASCYDPSWGRHKARTRPSPGNHDYNTSGATGYYNYFGALAGPAGRGYYSYDLGAWHIVSLNSNVSMSAGSAQEVWLRADLAASTKTCTIAYWHHPRFSSGSNHGSSTQSAGVWQALYDAGAEIVISGHDHEYERFAPQTPGAAADPARGIREFIVGTGGAGLYSFATPLPNSEVRDNTSFGVLKLTLSDGSYTWEFIPIAGDSFTDSGSGTCH